MWSWVRVPPRSPCISTPQPHPCRIGSFEVFGMCRGLVSSSLPAPLRLNPPIGGTKVLSGEMTSPVGFIRPCASFGAFNKLQYPGIAATFAPRRSCVLRPHHECCSGSMTSTIHACDVPIFVGGRSGTQSFPTYPKWDSVASGAVFRPFSFLGRLGATMPSLEGLRAGMVFGRTAATAKFDIVGRVLRLVCQTCRSLGFPSLGSHPS